MRSLEFLVDDMSPSERDDGLRQALKATGGFSGLARELGVAPQSVFEWKRVPAERVIQVEAVTKIPREVLRPDLYRKTTPKR